MIAPNSQNINKNIAHNLNEINIALNVKHKVK